MSKTLANYLKHSENRIVPTNFLRIQTFNVKKCANSNLMLHYSGKVYRIYCSSCRQEVGIMEVHGKYRIRLSEIKSFINKVTSKFKYH